MEQFYTLQGEGAFAGHAAYFIRLGGCDVGCTWCDVKDSWDAAAHPRTSIDAMVEAAAKYPARIAVVTGGEPLMHPLDALTDALHAAGFRTHIETSGAHPLSGSWDWLTLSPKKFKNARPDIIPCADELKIIVYNRHDLAWAETFARDVKPACRLLLQPEWSREAEMLPLIVEYVKNNPKWQVSLQTHKHIGIP